MAKDSYYFSHDYNARNDRKIAALVKDYRSSGYGIFWATCEMMHEEGGDIEFDELTIDSLAKDMNESPDLVRDVLEKCVTKYKLFTKQTKQNEAENFASLLQSGRIKRNLDSKKEKKSIKAESGRLGGIKSGESRRSEILPKQNEAERSTASSNEPNEIKGNEIKGKSNTEPIENVKGENEVVKFHIHGFEEIPIQVFNKCQSWQLKEIKNFITSSQQNFESIAMKNHVLKKQENFKVAVQAFVDMIQSTGEYQESNALRRHFGHWIGKKNGTLEVFLQECVRNNISGQSKKMVF